MVSSICSGSQRRERRLHHAAATQQLPDLQSSIWVRWWGSCLVADFFFFFYELNLMKALVPASNYGLSLQAGAGWMLWSWLSAAPVSTSWQPKQGEKQILARLQSPHIYSTCCSLPHSVIQSCYSKQYTHTAAHSDIILIYLTFISYCWAICVSCDHITITSCCSCPFTHKTAGSFTRHIVAVLCVQYSEIPDGRSKI